MTDFRAMFSGYCVLHRDESVAWFHEGLDAVARVKSAPEGGPVATAPTMTQRLPVHIISVRGPMRPGISTMWDRMGWTTYGGLARDIADADADDGVKVIVLDIDTPGGSARGIDEAAAAIRASGTPVHAWCGGLCASGGYWIGSQCKELTGEPWAVFGSIGVANYSSAPKSVGMFDGWQDAITTSSNAPNKIPDPHTEQGRAAIQQEIDVIETDFIAAVAMGRKKTIEQVAENFGRGGVMSGRAAVSVGMIDRTIRLDEYVAELGGQRGGNARAAMAAAFG